MITILQFEVTESNNSVQYNRQGAAERRLFKVSYGVGRT